MGGGKTGGCETDKTKADEREMSDRRVDSRRADGRKNFDSGETCDTGTGGRKNAGGRRIIKNYTGEVTVKEMRETILKLLMDDQERGIV